LASELCPKMLLKQITNNSVSMVFMNDIQRRSIGEGREFLIRQPIQMLIKNTLFIDIPKS